MKWTVAKNNRLFIIHNPPSPIHFVKKVYYICNMKAIGKLIEYFEKTMPDAESELNYTNNFELLVAVMLSAQCTDKRVNMVTPQLFAHYPDAPSMAEATSEEILAHISSISYPNSKARHLAEMAQMLTKEFGGEVPSNHDDLVRLPGVGRKTANVVMAVAFGSAAMPVDTHVFRVSHRIGLADDSCTTPLSVERRLTSLFPTHLLSRAHHWLILHGRYVCKARTPNCKECGISHLCKEYKKKNKIKPSKPLTGTE